MKLLRRQRKEKGPGWPEIWRDVAVQMGGEYREKAKGQSEGGHVPHGPWEVVLDRYVVNTGQSTQVFTRARAFFRAFDDLGFTLARRRFFSRFAWFVPEDVPIGDSEIEEKYVLRSRHGARVRSLFHDRDLRELIKVQPSMRFEVKGLDWRKRRKLGSRLRMATVRTSGIVTEHERLTNYVRLIQTTLDQLHRIGSASDEAVFLDRHNGDLRRKLR